jgi:hypothetical protein
VCGTGDYISVVLRVKVRLSVEQISYEWKEISAVNSYSCAVAVLYFAVTVTTRCDWMRRTKTVGSHFNVTVRLSMSVL